MRRLRVTSSMQKQLVDLRTRSTRMGGVMSVPRILGVDEWEAVASAQQDALIAASWEDRNDRSKPQLAVGPDPANVSHRYRP